MKIAYFIDRLIRGGTELQLVEQINHLAERGFKQELFCLYKSEEHDDFDTKCKVHILGIRKLISRYCLRKIIFLGRYLKQNSFTIVQTYFFDSTVIGVLAGKLARDPKIFSCRRDLGFWYTPRLILVLRAINALTHGILVNSNAIKETVIKEERVNAEKVYIIPNGIDTEQYKFSKEKRKKAREEFGIKPGQICVGTITNMSRRVKRVDLFVEAADYVLRQKKDIRFLVLGEGIFKKDLIAMAHSLGIENCISFLGRKVSKHTVLSAMDIGVLTSDSEGFSNAIMEYMAAGIPVVATGVGGNVELVEDEWSGFLTSPGDYKEIGEKIFLLAKDHKKCVNFGNRGNLLIERHSWDNIIERTFEYYQNQICTHKSNEKLQ